MSAAPKRNDLAGIPLPSGTVTFVFTDIEGSTKRWDDNPAAMSDALRRHDALMGAVIAEHDGQVFKTIGDAFCVAFARAEDAVAAMRAAQRALLAEDFRAVGGLRVRTAIHTGTAEERDGDYFGPTLNRVARLLAIGHGGQILVSGATTLLVKEMLPPDTGIRYLGEHRLKDLTSPERVYQIVAPELLADFPPLRSLGARPNNLPAQLTSFVGRETEVAEIAALLRANRLVSLVGAGGVGKTRASLHVAADLLEEYDDGVWFIELAPLTSGDYIPSTIAQALRLELGSQEDPLADVARAMETKNALLVFDNCEHVADAATRVIATMLRRAPGLHVLATSRQALRVDGEQTYRVPSLPVPSGDRIGELTAVEAFDSPAVALFVERALAVDKRFALSDANASAVAEICRRLDGIPLALELAAARVKILAPRELRERLDQRFRVLTSGSRDLLPRQQTLRALIDWSYDLLDDRERGLFGRLGIFVGGYSMEGAVIVGSGENLDEFDVLDVLGSLVDKSLVIAEDQQETRRYRLLESTRAYALEKLDLAGGREDCAVRHLVYIRDLVIGAQARFEENGRGVDFAMLFERELGDIRAALTHASRGVAFLIGAEIVGTLYAMWRDLHLEAEAIAWSEAFLAIVPEHETRHRANLWHAIAYNANSLVRVADAVTAASRAVDYARACGDPTTLAMVLGTLAFNLARRGDRESADQALREAESLPGQSNALRLSQLRTRTAISAMRRDLANAFEDYERLRHEARLLDNAEPQLVQTLAEIEHAAGNTARAVMLVEEVTASQNAKRGVNHYPILTNLAGYLVALGDVTGASRASRQVIRVLGARDPRSLLVAIAAEHLALAIALGGDLVRAARLEGYADAALRESGFPRSFTEQTTHEQLLSLLQATLSRNECTALLAEGAALEATSAIELALASP